MFVDSDYYEIIEKDLAKLLVEEDEYQSNDSGFTLQHIDGLPLIIYLCI